MGLTVTTPRRVADLSGGEIIRAADGNLWRIGRMRHESPIGCHRWARRLLEDRTETDDVIYLHPSMTVVELVEPARTRDGSPPPVDPDPVRGER